MGGYLIAKKKTVSGLDQLLFTDGQGGLRIGAGPNYVGREVTLLNSGTQGIIDYGDRDFSRVLLVLDLATATPNKLYAMPCTAGAASVFSTASKTRFLPLTIGAAFVDAGQPDDDSVTVRSNSASDIGKTFTIYSNIYGSTTLIKGQKTLAAANVDEDITRVGGTAETHWGKVVAVEASAAPAGTITFKEKSGLVTLTTLAPAALSKGIVEVAAASQDAYDLQPYLVASAACILKVGVWGTTAVMGTTETGELVTMAGTTPVYAAGCCDSVTKLLLGNVIAATSISAGLYGITLASGATCLKDAGGDSEAFNFSEPMRYMLWAAYSGTTLTAGGANDRLISVLQG